MIKFHQPEALIEAARTAPIRDSVRKALEHFARTGTYRQEDLRTLLGDPNGSVEIGPDTTRPPWAQITANK